MIPAEMPYQHMPVCSGRVHHDLMRVLQLPWNIQLLNQGVDARDISREQAVPLPKIPW